MGKEIGAVVVWSMDLLGGVQDFSPERLLGAMGSSGTAPAARNVQGTGGVKERGLDTGRSSDR